jgi:hypothetical protein
MSRSFQNVPRPEEKSHAAGAATPTAAPRSLKVRIRKANAICQARRRENAVKRIHSPGFNCASMHGLEDGRLVF